MYFSVLSYKNIVIPELIRITDNFPNPFNFFQILDEYAGYNLSYNLDIILVDHILDHILRCNLDAILAGMLDRMLAPYPGSHSEFIRLVSWVVTWLSIEDADPISQPGSHPGSVS